MAAQPALVRLGWWPPDDSSLHHGLREGAMARKATGLPRGMVAGRVSPQQDRAGMGRVYEILGEDPVRDQHKDWRQIGPLKPTHRHFLFYRRDDTFECLAADWWFHRPGIVGLQLVNGRSECLRRSNTNAGGGRIHDIRRQLANAA